MLPEGHDQRRDCRMDCVAAAACMLRSVGVFVAAAAAAPVLVATETMATACLRAASNVAGLERSIAAGGEGRVVVVVVTAAFSSPGVSGVVGAVAEALEERQAWLKALSVPFPESTPIIPCNEVPRHRVSKCGYLSLFR